MFCPCETLKNVGLLYCDRKGNRGERQKLVKRISLKIEKGYVHGIIIC